MTRTKQQRGVYAFAFATYGGTPNATVGGKGINATRTGASFGGVTLVSTAVASTPASRPPRRR